MSTAPQAPNEQPQNFAVRGQYIKDLSFENPNSPHSLMGNQPPQIAVDIDLKAQKLQDDMYEMILHITARATSDQGALFLVDLSYAGVFQIIGVPEERIEQVIMVDCPFVLFPFARRVVADITRDGGFPPLMLDPIDFFSLYAQNKARTQATA